MKIKIEGYGWMSAPKQELNFISILADKAAQCFTLEGKESLAKQAQEFSDTIYNALYDQGFYQ